MVSYKKAIRRWRKIFKTSNKKSRKSSEVENTKSRTTLLPRKSSPSSDCSDVDLSPTSTNSSILSESPNHEEVRTDNLPATVPVRPLHDLTIEFIPPDEINTEERGVDHGNAHGLPNKNGNNDFSKYGYEDASPDSASNNDDNRYGYEHATPDDRSKYGYGDASPLGFSIVISQRTPRRSSMKQGNRPRRASIQLCGQIENILPGSGGKKVKRRTSITFDESVKVKTVAPIKALADEHEALWFQDDEFHRMKQKCFEIVDKVDHGLTEGRKFCVRGLEALSSSRRAEVRGRKYEAWDSVLDEQENQRDSGEFDEESLANLYKLSTMKTQKEAEERGQQDAADIENYLRSTRQYCRRFST